MAKDCPSPKQCDMCGSFDHLKVGCPHSGKKCDNCGKVGHLKAKCHSPGMVKAYSSGVASAGAGAGAPWVNKTCDICGVLGHLKASCPKGGKGAGGAGGKTCDICGQLGHLKASCPNGRGTGKTCDVCGQVGHLKAACPQGAEMTECWDFERKGTCPRGDRCSFSHGGVPPNPPPGPGGRTCHNCGMAGHLRANCPLLKD